MTSYQKHRFNLKSVLDEISKYSPLLQEVKVLSGNNEVTIHLEEPICHVLEEIATSKDISLTELCENVLAEGNIDISPESRLRVFAIERLRSIDAIMLCERRTHSGAER